MNKLSDKNFRLWIYAALLITGSVFLFVGGPDYHSSRSFRDFWNVGHIIYFALLTDLLLRSRYLALRPLVFQWFAILGITLVLGVAIEFMQKDTMRMPDTGDVLRDLTGSLLVLVFVHERPAAQDIRRWFLLQAAVIVLLLSQLWPLVRSLTDEAIAWHQFPLLSGFETPFEIDRWKGSAQRSVEFVPAISKGKLLRLSLTTNRYSGTLLNYFNRDWTSFRTLVFSIYNPDEKHLEITCRINDLQHIDGHEEYEDRFNRIFILGQGWNRIEIDLEEVEAGPANRNMNMRQIRGFGFFVMSQPEPRIIYLDNVRLYP